MCAHARARARVCVRATRTHAINQLVVVVVVVVFVPFFSPRKRTRTRCRPLRGRWGKSASTAWSTRCRWASTTYIASSLRIFKTFVRSFVGLFVRRFIRSCATRTHTHRAIGCAGRVVSVHICGGLRVCCVCFVFFSLERVRFVYVYMCACARVLVVGMN